MLADAETWAENLRAILENNLGKFADDLEKALTAEFGSFDNFATSMERASSLQEEYLTTTNKIYETNKMMRNA
jgi:superoxide dismutase